MSGIPFYNSDETILQAVQEILTDPAQTLDLITILNERHNLDLPLVPLLPGSVERMISADDANHPPQSPVVVRCDLLSNRELARSISIGQSRTAYRLQIRVLVRWTAQADPDANVALASTARGYAASAQHAVTTRLRNIFSYALERRLIGYKLVDPDGGDPLCTGIYSFKGPFTGAIDRPVSGDSTLLRATVEYDVYIKTRSGAGTSSPV